MALRRASRGNWGLAWGWFATYGPLEVSYVSSLQGACNRKWHTVSVKQQMAPRRHASGSPSDAQLIAYFHSSPQEAWRYGEFCLQGPSGSPLTLCLYRKCLTCSEQGLQVTELKLPMASQHSVFSAGWRVLHYLTIGRYNVYHMRCYCMWITWGYGIRLKAK